MAFLWLGSFPTAVCYAHARLRLRRKISGLDIMRSCLPMTPGPSMLLTLSTTAANVLAGNISICFVRPGPIPRTKFVKGCVGSLSP